MNSDSIFSLQTGTGRNNLLSVGSLGTSETIFTMGSDSGTPVNAFVAIPSPTAILGSFNPLDPNAGAATLQDNFGGKNASVRGAQRPYVNTTSFDARGFRVRASGKFTTSAIDSVTGHAIKLYQNTSAVLAAANLLISAPSSATLAAGSYNWVVEATLLWDLTSQKLVGEAWGYVADTYTARSTIAPITVTSMANLLFVCSVKFNTGAANVITPVEFSIEDV